MTKRRVLVCGASGFIGKNIATDLGRRDDLEVHATHFTRPPCATPGVTWHRADLRSEAEVRAVVEGMDVIVQAAATTSGSSDIVNAPYLHVTDNAVMNSLLLRAAYDLGVGQFVFFSCSVMYHSSPIPLREDDFDPARGMEPRYFGVGSTKVYIEQMCRFFAGLGRTHHTVIRHSNVYGPHDKFDLRRSHVFGATITKALTAGDKLVVWGSGEEARDLIHVDDLARFVALAIDRQSTPHELVNVGAGRAWQIKDLVQRIVRASGRDLAIEHDLSRPTIPTSVALDCSRARELFGWSPSVDLDDGIRRTIEWWRSAYGNRPEVLL